VICKSDSQTALKFIQEGVRSTHPYAPLVDYIQSLIIKSGSLSLFTLYAKEMLVLIDLLSWEHDLCRNWKCFLFILLLCLIFV
jgi:hypothetical protein